MKRIGNIIAEIKRLKANSCKRLTETHTLTHTHTPSPSPSMLLPKQPPEFFDSGCTVAWQRGDGQRHPGSQRR